MIKFVRTTFLCLLMLAAALEARVLMSQPQSGQAEIRVGIIGLDTSHTGAFTKLLNDAGPERIPGARVVAAYKGGSPDVEASATRIERFTSEIKSKWGVEVVDSIEDLCKRVDAVLLLSVDGRRHLAQVKPVLAAHKRVFIDKPFTASVSDAREIVRLSRESGTPFFSSSSRRFSPDVQDLKKDAKVGAMLGAMAWGPAPTEPHHPDLFWYGIHTVETLYTLMGTGCETVSCTTSEGADVVVGRWKDGRIGVVRGMREGDGSHGYGAVAFGSKAVVVTGPPRGSDYRDLVLEIVKFFQTGMPPVPAEETLEILTFMQAADLSKARGGAPVALREVN